MNPSNSRSVTDALANHPVRNIGAPKLSRRTLLKGSLAATALVPLLDARRVMGQDAAPTRLVVIATPNGTRNQFFWPTGSERNFTLPELTRPLEAFQDRLLFLKGVRHNPAVVGDNGFAGGLNGSEHARGMGGMLTARPLGRGNFRSFMATSGWGSGVSLDQHLGNVLNPPTTFKTLELGVHVRDAEVRGRISYTGQDQPVPPRENPSDVFNALFAGGVPGSSEQTDESDAVLEQLRAERRSVFDLSLREIERLQGRLGTDDRAKLQVHLDSVRSIEQRLSASMGGGTPNVGSCTAPQVSDVNLASDDTYEQTGRLQMDLAAAALACDQTRILTLQWSYAESEHLFPFLDLNRNHHDISHDWAGTTGFEQYNKIHVWFAEQVAYFLGKLDSYQEGERSLLDNTVVFWASEIGESTQHDLTLMPYVLAGRAGGQLDTGRLIDFGNDRRDNNQLLISLAHLMGAEQITEFGDESGQMGPLPDLLV